MGLERLAAVLQKVHNNYDIDLFKTLVKAASDATGEPNLSNSSLRVIADHIRSCSFIIVDGVLPSNEGRGYVLRRIIRRAIRHGYKLGQKGVFFHKLVAPLVAEMGAAYPELKAQQANVERALKLEEERFAETLENGMRILDETIAQLKGKQIPGETVFKLYDTYGFPLDLTADIARERGLTLDEAGFEAAMQAQRERARAASHFGAQATQRVDYSGKTEFLGYGVDHADVKVVALFNEAGQAVSRLEEGQPGLVILDKTPFYAESGGQVADTGSLTEGMHSFHVNDVQKQGNAFLHLGQVTAGHLEVGQLVEARIDIVGRRASERNHSATHLLHAALRQVLGGHVAQKGSLVGPDRLRFDFAHFEPISATQLREIERLVNHNVMLNHAVGIQEMDIEAAKQMGAMALFGEKYGDVVRVVDMGEFSIELCGGTHVKSTGNIGPFRILSEGGVASGVRRIEAITGDGAWQTIYQLDDNLNHIAQATKADKAHLVDKVSQLVANQRELEKQLQQLQSKLAANQGEEILQQVKQVNGVNLLAAQMQGADSNLLRETVDRLKDKLEPAVIILASVEGEKVNLVAGVSKAVTDKFKAGELVNFVAQQVGGKGGGRPDMAQAGGKDPANLPQALASVEAWAAEK